MSSEQLDMTVVYQTLTSKKKELETLQANPSTDEQKIIDCQKELADMISSYKQLCYY